MSDVLSAVETSAMLEVSEEAVNGAHQQGLVESGNREKRDHDHSIAE